MDKVILYLEDDANMRRHTTELLKERGYNVEEFRRIDQVKEYFSRHADDIACIIADLNMADEWLGEYRAESDGGLMSGWVWLRYFVYPIKPNMPTIIYSGYTEYLYEALNRNDELSLLERDNIICVAKGAGIDEGFHGLINALKKLT